MKKRKLTNIQFFLSITDSGWRILSCFPEINLQSYSRKQTKEPPCESIRTKSMLKVCHFEDFTMSLQETKCSMYFHENSNITECQYEICTFRKFFKSKDIPTILILKFQNLRERWENIGKNDIKEKLKLRVSRKQLRRISCVSVMRYMVDGSDTVLFSDRKDPLGWHWKYNWRASGEPLKFSEKLIISKDDSRRSLRFNLENVE